jgi:nitrate/nitrite transport system permease protein
MNNQNIKAAIISLCIVLFAYITGEAMLQEPKQQKQEELSEYELLMGGSAPKAHLPKPSEVIAYAYEQIKDPFYDKGSNDKGIGIHLGYSLLRVLMGYVLAILVAVPAGFVIGMSPLLYKALNPFVQLLKPVSPLAWMPLALFLVKDSAMSAIFVIFICSVWPILINTIFGVASVKKDWLNVARMLQMNSIDTALKIVLPAAAPTIFTGLRISIGISWLVIVAAEMLVGGTGIGYFVWNEWNNLNLSSVIFSILTIGSVGMLLDFILARISKAFSYQE